MSLSIPILISSTHTIYKNVYFKVKQCLIRITYLFQTGNYETGNNCKPFSGRTTEIHCSVSNSGSCKSFSFSASPHYEIIKMCKLTGEKRSQFNFWARLMNTFKENDLRYIKLSKCWFYPFRGENWRREYINILFGLNLSKEFT